MQNYRNILQTISGSSFQHVDELLTKAGVTFVSYGVV